MYPVVLLLRCCMSCLRRRKLLWQIPAGPTEASVMVATFPCNQYSGIGSVPIGRPIHNTRLYVLDPHSLQPLPVGAPGELFASGIGVARGYAGQPQLTAERFLPNPFRQLGDSPGYDRMYRTGDVVAWLPDGNLRWKVAPSEACCHTVDLVSHSCLTPA